MGNRSVSAKWSFISIVCSLLFLAPLTSFAAVGLTNADFSAQSGSWQDGEGPPGWALSLDRDDQFGIVEDIDFAFSGSRSFYFSALGRGFGDSRMDQCVVLDDPFDALMLSVHVLTDEPDPELALRLRVDFYADSACDEDSANSGDEQIGTDVGLSEERVDPGEWTRIDSETRLASELGEDVRSARISLRVRDRSNDGQPRDPARIVWLDAVSLEADVTFLPAAQRDALRDLYTATDGPNWVESLGWMDAEGTECSWHGVTCSDSGETLLRLDLSGNGLIGELPENLQALSDLTPGEGLDLCWNEILIDGDLTDFVSAVHIGGDPGFCQGVDRLPFSQALTGNYFQPEGRDGEGFSLNMLGAGAALLYWATYDDEGEPLWLFGSGRANGRVLRIPDLYTTGNTDGELDIQRVGQASLVFTTDSEQPDCRQALLRFSADGAAFGAMDGRELTALDEQAGCSETAQPDGLLTELAGVWFDPDLDGQGLTFTPLGSDRLVLNWFGYDEDGQQVWRIGSGVVAGADSIQFEELLAVSGGSFNGPISPDGLDFDTEGSALLTRTEAGWEFDLREPDGRLIRLHLSELDASPDLLAATGRRIDLEMAPEDLAELYQRSPFSDDRLPGQVRFDGSDEVQALTGVRFRGSSSRRMPKKSFNIRFENPQPLLFGSDRMNLNAMYTDPTGMREALSFGLFHLLGQPAPKTRHFDLWINGIYEGTYTHIQRVDETLLEQSGLNPEGTLVRDNFRDFEELSPSAFGHDFYGLDRDERLALIADTFGSRGDPEWEPVLELIEWVQATPTGADFAAGFAERVDVENFIDWLALHWILGDIDSFADDYWLYLDHDDPDARWQFIPWDKDLALGSHWRGNFFDTSNDFFAYEYLLTTAQQPGNELFNKFMRTPALRDQAYARLRELLEELLPVEPRMERAAALAEQLEDSFNIRRGPQAFAIHPGNHHGVADRFADQAESIRDFIELRSRFLSRQIDPIQGAEDQAEATVEEGWNRPVFLTDATGFTMASVRPLDVFGKSALSIAVEPGEDINGINHRWLMNVSSWTGPVELTLYYRNDISGAWGRGNWYTGGGVPIGRQDELQLVMTTPTGTTEMPPVRINPYSNKAVAEVDLEPGEYEFMLILD